MRRALAACLLLLTSPLAAELTHQGDQGFTVEHVVEVTADPSTAWSVMTGHIDTWWHPDHSWSGDAHNLYLRAERGGCLCERLPGGGEVEHLRIIYHDPGRELRFDGALGPLQTMAVNGRMTWKVEATDGGSRVAFTYHVFGHPAGGLAGIAPAVDGVIGQQLTRLAQRLGQD